MSYPFEETKYLCVSSGLMGVSSLLLYGLHEYTLAFLLGILCLTSLNHWRNYVNRGIRQRIDVSWVVICSLYIAWKILSQGCEYKNSLFLSVLVSCSFFWFISLRAGGYWLVAHATLHLYLSFFVPLLTIL
jgi:hypothetical protein